MELRSYGSLITEDAKAEAKPAASASTPDSKSTSQKKSGDANKENIGEKNIV